MLIFISLVDNHLVIFISLPKPDNTENRNSGYYVVVIYKPNTHHGASPARENVRERFEFYGIIYGRLPILDSSRFKLIWISISKFVIKSHGLIQLVGHNPRAASGFTDVYSVWLKCQVQERVSVLSLDIGTGFQIFRRRFTEIQAHLEGCAPRPAEGQVAQRP